MSRDKELKSRSKFIPIRASHPRQISNKANRYSRPASVGSHVRIARTSIRSKGLPEIAEVFSSRDTQSRARNVANRGQSRPSRCIIENFIVSAASDVIPARDNIQRAVIVRTANLHSVCPMDSSFRQGGQYCTMATIGIQPLVRA